MRAADPPSRCMLTRPPWPSVVCWFVQLRCHWPQDTDSGHNSRGWEDTTASCRPLPAPKARAGSFHEGIALLRYVCPGFLGAVPGAGASTDVKPGRVSPQTEGRRWSLTLAYNLRPRGTSPGTLPGFPTVHPFLPRGWTQSQGPAVWPQQARPQVSGGDRQGGVPHAIWLPTRLPFCPPQTAGLPGGHPPGGGQFFPVVFQL